MRGGWSSASRLRGTPSSCAHGAALVALHCASTLTLAVLTGCHRCDAQPVLDVSVDAWFGYPSPGFFFERAHLGGLAATTEQGGCEEGTERVVVESAVITEVCVNPDKDGFAYQIDYHAPADQLPNVVTMLDAAYPRAVLAHPEQRPGAAYVLGCACVLFSDPIVHVATVTDGGVKAVWIASSEAPGACRVTRGCGS